MEMNRDSACQMIGQMEAYLRAELFKKDGTVQEEKLWENTFIKRQIDRRSRGEAFSLEDHIRAMVYAMVSSCFSWNRIAEDTDPGTGRLVSVDRIFFGYDTGQLLNSTPEQLRDALKEAGCATQSTLKQMNALLSVDIPKLLDFEKEYGSIDAYYQSVAEGDATLKTLITALSDADSKDKLAQMEVALVCEYLRNIGYNIPKPDRHIRRILGCDYLALSEQREVPVFEAFDLVVKLAELAGKPAAEADYILWAYCASGYGVCTLKSPKCDACAVKSYCGKGDAQRN